MKVGFTPRLRKAIRQCVMAAAASAGVACATSSSPAPPLPIGWPGGSYGNILKADTRSVSIYSGLDAVLFAYATDETDKFQKARSEKLAEMYHVPAGPLADKRGGDITEPLPGHVFFLAVNTSERGANDLERPTSQWAVSLETGGRVLHPDSIIRLASRTSAIQSLYPYVDRFFASYRVLFKEDIGPGPYSLVIAGPAGEGRMTFTPGSPPK